MGTYIYNIKEESLIIKEEGDTKADDSGYQSYLWDKWVMDVYPLVLPHKVKRPIEGLHVLCRRLWKIKVIHGMFKCLGDKYGVFDRTLEGSTLGRGWITRRRR